MDTKKGEYTPNTKRDWMMFFISTILMIVILVVKPEWCWVMFPFVLTALAGAMHRM